MNKSALNYALWLLGLRAYSESEIRKKLNNKKFPLTEINSVCQKLKNLKLIDDLNYSINWIQNRDNSLPRSGKMLRLELVQKGVRIETIEKAFEIYEDSNGTMQDRDRAKLLVEKQLKKESVNKKEKFAKRKYLLALLARKLFSYDLSREVVEEIE